MTVRSAAIDDTLRTTLYSGFGVSVSPVFKTRSSGNLCILSASLLYNMLPQRGSLLATSSPTTTAASNLCAHNDNYDACTHYDNDNEGTDNNDNHSIAQAAGCVKQLPHARFGLRLDDPGRGASVQPSCSVLRAASRLIVEPPLAAGVPRVPCRVHAGHAASGDDWQWRCVKATFYRFVPDSNTATSGEWRKDSATSATADEATSNMLVTHNITNTVASSTSPPSTLLISGVYTVHQSPSTRLTAARTSSL